MYYNPRAFEPIDDQDQEQSSSFIHRDVINYSKPFGTLLRKDTAEIMTDKLAMIDLIFNEHTKSADETTEYLIREMVSKYDGFKGDADKLL